MVFIKGKLVEIKSRELRKTRLVKRSITKIKFISPINDTPNPRLENVTYCGILYEESENNNIGTRDLWRHAS